MFILLVGLTRVSVKSNTVSKKFNNNLTASSSHGQYPRLEMTEVWSVRLEVTAAAIWLLRWAGRRSPMSVTQREMHGHQTWYSLGELLHWSTSGKYRWPLVMGAVGTCSEPLRSVFNSKKYHNPYSPSSPTDCKHTGTAPTLVIMLGLATEALRWSHNNLLSHSLPLYSLQSTREIHILALLTGR